VIPFTAIRPSLRYSNGDIKPMKDANVENTITEQDLDAGSQQFVNSLRTDDLDIESDLSVDGLSDSLMSRLYSFFMMRK
jgi:hypothetical protein